MSNCHMGNSGRATRTCRSYPPHIPHFTGGPPVENYIKKWDIVGKGGLRWKTVLVTVYGKYPHQYEGLSIRTRYECQKEGFIFRCGEVCDLESL